MRQVYRLLGLVRRHGTEQADLACARALEVEVVNVGLIERILSRGLHTGGLEGIQTMAPARPAGDDAVVAHTAAAPASGTTVEIAVEIAVETAMGSAGGDATTVVPAAGRFARDPAEFSVRRPS